jgi:hypothetical protein
VVVDPHVRELAVKGSRRSGANAMLADVAPNQPLDHAAVLRFGNQIRPALRYESKPTCGPPLQTMTCPASYAGHFHDRRSRSNSSAGIRDS